MESQFVSACEASLTEGENDPGENYCQCAFFTVASELGFEEFLELDEQLRDDPGSLSLEDRNLIEGVSLPCSITADEFYAAG